MADAKNEATPSRDEAGIEELAPELSPANYIEKVSLVTGEVLDEEILPKQLLVSHHRDYHLADIQARRFMSRLLQTTGDEETVREKMKEIRERGHRTAEAIAKMLRKAEPIQVSKALFGLKRKEYYFRYKKYPASDERIEAYLQVLKERAEKTASEGRREWAWSAGVAHRWHRFRGPGDPLAGGPGREHRGDGGPDPAEDDPRSQDGRGARGAPLPRCEERSCCGACGSRARRAATKFRFVAGDVEAPDLGIDAEEKKRLSESLTHVIHCAASVAFDDPYEKSFRANVTGTLNALEFSESLQESEGSPFIHHISIETSYIHGRQVQQVAREDEVVFPRNFYNNYYELTKAMASIESERFMLSRGLRVVQLCPAIVIGEAATGNNRGDTKVVNAPVNVFGRAHEAMSHSSGKIFERSKTSMLAKMACVFPGDPSARINLIPGGLGESGHPGGGAASPGGGGEGPSRDRQPHHLRRDDPGRRRGDRGQDSPRGAHGAPQSHHAGHEAGLGQLPAGSTGQGARKAGNDLRRVQ